MRRNHSFSRVNSHVKLARGTSTTKGIAFLVIVSIMAFMVAFFEQTGGTEKKPDLMSHQVSGVSGFSENVSLQTVSDAETQKIATDLKAAVPGLSEIYVQRLTDGGVSIVATSSLRGLPHTYLTASDDATRYLLAAYRIPGIKVDFASVYIEEQGRYVMAVGLGDQAAKTLTLSAFAPDQGEQLTHDLASIDRYTNAMSQQAFAEYQQP